MQEQGKSSFLRAAEAGTLGTPACDELAGPERAAWSAVEKLGPFATGNDENPDRPIEISIESACSQVWYLAFDYSNTLRWERASPRLSHVVEQLDRLESAVEGTARELVSLDDYTKTRLQLSRECKKYWETKADIAGLPMPSAFTRVDASGAWVRRLVALRAHIRGRRESLLSEYGVQPGSAVDRGGNTNLYKSKHGPAALVLINSGWHIFEAFHPGKASGTEGGPLHLFLMDVFEYATGLDPEEHSRLTAWLKKSSKVNRGYYDILARQQAVKDQLTTTPTSEFATIASLEQSAADLEKVRKEYIPKMYQPAFTRPEWVKSHG